MNLQDVKIGDIVRFDFPKEVAEKNLKMYLLTTPQSEWTINEGNSNKEVILYWGVTRVRIPVRDLMFATRIE